MESNKSASAISKHSLTPEQEKKALEFHEKVLTEYKKLVPSQENIENFTDINDTTRFLIARKFDNTKAMDMWTNWRKWKIEYGVDNINEKDIENELRAGKAFWYGRDKQNRPCLIVKIKRHRPGQISTDETVKFGVYMIEQGIKKCNEAGADQIVIIYDREGFEKKNFDTKLAGVLKSLIKILQDYYAERLAMMYVLHPNWFYKVVFGMIKPFLDEKTRQKIKLVDKLEDLKEEFREDQLLVEHGGTSTYQYSWPKNSEPITDIPVDADVQADNEGPQELSEIEKLVMEEQLVQEPHEEVAKAE